MKKTILNFLVVTLLALTLCACGSGPKNGTAVVSEEWSGPEVSVSTDGVTVDMAGMTPEDAMPAYSAYYAYDKDGNELYHEIYWFDETGATTDSDVTEMPDGAVVAYADYTELDADGSELWSEHMNY